MGVDEYLNPVEICGEAWSRGASPREAVVLGTVPYTWDGTGHVWLSSRPDGLYPISCDDIISVETSLGVGNWLWMGKPIFPSLTKRTDAGGGQPFLVPGLNEITVTIKNDGYYGSIGSSPIYVVRVPNAVPDFTVSPRSGPAPLTVQIIDTSLYMDPSLCMRYSERYWVVGGSNGFSYYSTEQDLLLTLEAPGLYWVRRYASNSNGGGFSKLDYIRVLPPPSRRRRAAWMNMERPAIL